MGIEQTSNCKQKDLIFKQLLTLDLTRNLSQAQRLKIASALTSGEQDYTWEWWNQPGFGKVQLPAEDDVSRCQDSIANLGISILAYGAADYPAALRALSSPPLLLFARGNTALLQQPLCAIVGTRNPSGGASQWTYETAKELAARKITVLSGGAKGIDSSAIKGGLQGGRPPVIILGVPINQFYPQEEAALQQKVLEQGGLILSEYSPDRSVQRAMFLARNRLIAALSQGVLMSSCGIPSGALSTAGWAAKLGRPLMTLPLSPWEKSCTGNTLLLQRGALCVTDTAQVCQALQGNSLTSRNLDLPLDTITDSQNDPELPPEESRIMETLRGGPLLTEELLAETGLPMSQISSLLLTMELGGYVERRADGKFARR